jgi:hypothetical protein
MRSRLAVSLSAIAFAVACVEAFTPGDQLASPRVLAIRTDPVELSDDGGVTLQALIWVPGGGSPTSWSWSWCPQLGTALDNYACALNASALATLLSPDGGITIDYDAGTTATVGFSWPIPPDVLRAICAAQSTDAGDTDAGSLDAGDADAGLDGGADGGTVVGLRLFCGNSLSLAMLLDVTAGGRQLSATRTLTVAYDVPSSVNTNPTIDSLEIDGGVLIAGHTYQLLAAVPTLASDQYLQTLRGPGQADTDGGADGGPQPPPARTITALEGLSIAWYVEQGTLGTATTTLAPGELDDAGIDGRDFNALGTNTWAVPANVSGQVTVIAVIRDTRSGVAWLQRTFDVQKGTP